MLPTGVAAQFFRTVWNYVFRQTIHNIWINHTSGIHGAQQFLEDPYAIVERSLRLVIELLSTLELE